MIAKRHCKAEYKRRGFQAVELLFVLPVMALLLVAAVQFGRTMTIRSSIMHAAILAAREAAKGSDVADVAEAVNCVLAAHGLAITDRPGSGTKLVLQEECKPAAQYGDPNMGGTISAAVRRDEILATVWVKPSAKRVDGRRLFASACDVLGLVSGGTQLTASALAKRHPAGRSAADNDPTTDKTTIALASRDATTLGNKGPVSLP